MVRQCPVSAVFASHGRKINAEKMSLAIVMQQPANRACQCFHFSLVGDPLLNVDFTLGQDIGDALPGVPVAVDWL